MEASHQAISLMMGHEVATIFFCYSNYKWGGAGGERLTHALYPDALRVAKEHWKCSSERVTTVHTLITVDDLEKSIKSGEAVQRQGMQNA